MGFLREGPVDSASSVKAEDELMEIRESAESEPVTTLYYVLGSAIFFFVNLKSYAKSGIFCIFFTNLPFKCDFC